MTTRALSAKYGPWPKKVDGRSGARVLRNTRVHEADSGGFFRRIEKQDRFAIIRGMWAIANGNASGRRRRGKAEARRGDLYDLHAHLIDWMISRSMNWITGRLECTYSMICKGTELSRATVARLIADLIRAGILEKLRRWRFNAEDGSKIEQAPNAYRINLTNRLRAASGRSRPAPPKPTPHQVAEALRLQAAREERAAQFDRAFGPTRPEPANQTPESRTDE